jgi:microcystin-dependent protein
MAEPYIGEIRLFGGNFAPKNYALCDGQILAISQNQALFAILGTTYGGNGASTFGLPDLRGRVPVGAGQAPGLSIYTLGEQTGTEGVALTQNQLPQHTHLVSCTSTSGTAGSPAGAIFAKVPVARGSVNIYGTTTDVSMSPASIGVSGGSVPHNNVAPYLGISFIIALFGAFPSRN